MTDVIQIVQKTLRRVCSCLFQMSPLDAVIVCSCLLCLVVDRGRVRALVVVPSSTDWVELYCFHECVISNSVILVPEIESLLEELKLGNHF